MRARWIAASLATGIVVVIALRVLLGDGATKSHAGAGHAPARTATADAASTALPDTSLPPPNAPLSQVLERLRDAAARGNGPAACRLAMEIQRCAAHAYDVQGLEQLKRLPVSQLILRGKFAELLAAAVAEARSRVDTDGRVCRDTPASDAKPWRLLLDAALQGHVPSMARFASGTALRGRGEWDLDAFGAYRAYALIFLRRAAEEGDAASIERLGVEHLMPGFGTRAIPYDPVRGLAYLRALAARASPSYREQLDENAALLIAKAGMQGADIAAADKLAATILPAEALTRLAGVSKATHGPEDDFGCR